MEIALQVARARRSEEQLRNRKWDGTIGPSVEEVYNLGTILGAQAVGLEHEICSLVVGKKADIVVFNSKTPAMLAAADGNPIAAIVLHSSVQDVQTVIIDGVIRKENTLLNKIAIPQDIAQKEEMVANTSESLEWDEVAREVEKSHQRLKEIRGAVDEEAARNGLIRSFIAAMKLASDH